LLIGVPIETGSKMSFDTSGGLVSIAQEATIDYALIAEDIDFSALGRNVFS
jgi:hypothetical protein